MPILTRKDGAILWITLNRPERLNAMNAQLVDGLTQALHAANDDPTVRVIIVNGAGRAFCSGDDLKDIETQAYSENAARDWVGAIQYVTRQIIESEKIVIAAVHGWCVGGALEWVINCDFRLFVEDTKWFFPEVTYGLFVTGGVTALFTKLVGPQVALELMMLGERHTAEDALRLGIAWKLVSKNDLLNEAKILAERIIDKPATAVTDIKRAVNTGYHSSLQDAMEIETEATVRAFLSPEARARAKEY